MVLKSFQYQSISKDSFEIILVDDGSSDNTALVVQQYLEVLNIKYIKQNNLGRSHARNTGIKLACADIIIFCDDDVIVSKNFIACHLDCNQKNQNTAVHGKIYNLPYLRFFANPSTGEFYPHIDSSKSNISFLKKFLLQLIDIETLDKLNKQKKISLFEKQIKEIFTNDYQQLKFLGFTGGNVSINRGALLKAGGFDENFDKIWGAEDLELGYRLQKSGVNFIYSDEAINYHIVHHRPDYKENLVTSFTKFYNKHQNIIIRKLPDLLLGKIKSVGEFIKNVSEN